MRSPAPLLALALLSACSSNAREGGRPEITGHPQRIAYVDYRSGLWLELVNESHTGRVEQYSETRQDASRKVQSDEVLKGLIDAIRGQGFTRLARPGPAPRGASVQAAMALEIDDAGALQHVLGIKGMDTGDRKAVLGMAQSFVEIYNATYGLQAVEVPEGQSPFQNPVGPTKHKPPQVLDAGG